MPLFVNGTAKLQKKTFSPDFKTHIGYDTTCMAEWGTLGMQGVWEDGKWRISCGVRGPLAGVA